MMRKTLLCLLITLLIVGLTVSTNEHIIVSASSNAIGILYQNTTWTKAGNPYVLTGPLAVNTGVTLTIQPGVVVDLNSYYIQVNGTLTAIGTSGDKIQFSGGEINFKPVSNGWNQRSDSGSQFQYAIFQSTRISSSVPLKVAHCQTNAEITLGGSSEITDDILSKTTVTGSCTAVRNTITGVLEISSNFQSLISDNTINGDPNTAAVKVTGGSTTIINNKLTGGGILTYPPFRGETIVYAVEVCEGTAQISNNNIDGGALAGNSSVITTNILVNGGIHISDGSPIVSGNNFVGYGGISIGDSKNSLVDSPIIFNNTVSCISVYAGSVQIQANTLRGTGLNLGIGFNQEYQSGNSVVANNYVYNCCYGLACWSEGGNPTVTFEKNYVVDCEYGMTLTGGTISIENNTIRNNHFGIYLGLTVVASNIANNNIENNNHGNLNIANITAPINAANNWWGTTDETVIGQTIHDSKFDFNLAKVTYVPFLNGANSQAMPDQAVTIPIMLSTPDTTATVTPTQQPISNPTQNPSEQPNTSSSPTHSPTSTGPSNVAAEEWFTFDKTLIVVLAMAVAALVIVVAVLYRKVASI